MERQAVYVRYTDLTGNIEYFHENGDQFNGDLECPPEGKIFRFLKKDEPSDWNFSGFGFHLTDGPDDADFDAMVSADSINLTDSGNGPGDDSYYHYTVFITTVDDAKRRDDPKIKNTGGGSG